MLNNSAQIHVLEVIVVAGMLLMSLFFVRTFEFTPNITKTEENISQESADRQNDLRGENNFSEVIKDSISDSKGKISSILEKILIKEKFVEYHGDSCNEIKFNLKCYQNKELLFSRTIFKKDFYKFLDTANLKVNKYMLTSCYIDSIARNPLELTFRLNICS